MGYNTKYMKIINRKARFNYCLEPERVEAGLSLLGAEAKAVRDNRADLSEAVVRILNKEAYLINANLPASDLTGYQPTRSRKLLLHRSELITLETRAKQQKLTLIPLALYTKGHLVKLEIALGKPKRKFEKRGVIKARDLKRELEKEFKIR